jgi:oleate hydratase
MFESKYVCTYDLFSSIPTLDDSKTVTAEIFGWNEVTKTSSRSRLIRSGGRQNSPRFGLGEIEILKLEALALEPEAMLADSSIADHLPPSFFKSDFWFMWCSTFAFQPWHSAAEFKRYLLRFIHMVSGFNKLDGIMRTVYNQYDSLVRPMQKWLAARGVRFELNTTVTDLSFRAHDGKTAVDRILFERKGESGGIRVGDNDYVLVTLGSMTESSSLGSNDSAPILKGEADGGSWSLWKKIAAGKAEFGRPEVFSNHVTESKWVSFTATLRDSVFLNKIRELTGNVPGEGGLITFPESSWLASIVIPHQPHFIGQPQSVDVVWGYGLNVDAPGDFVQKPMSACNGREIMQEILWHLRIKEESSSILANCTCIPCMMPFITSQFLCRRPGDRPHVIPKSAANFGFLGQFCELPDDVVFTVEYSVRSAQTAVYQLLGLKRKPPAMYQGKFDPHVIYSALKALHDQAA